MNKSLTLLSIITLGLTLSTCTRKIAPATTVTTSTTNFLFLSDVHLAANRESTNYGDDAGTALWGTIKSKITDILNSPNPPQFILYTGDMPEHGGINNPPQRNKNITNVLADLHAMSATKNIPLFYLPGNNDALGGNYCFFTDDNGQTPFSLVQQYSPYPYQAFNVSNTPVSNGAYIMSGSNLASGYYSTKIMNGLRIISLNSVMWSSQLCNNCNEVNDCQQQPGDGQAQMDWLKNQLNNAADSGDKVYIAMHIPPGMDAYLSRNNPSNPTPMWQDDARWQNQFLQALAQHTKTVAGIFYGHTHMDEFRMLYRDSLGKSFSQVAISCPGISARSNNNPGFKLVAIDNNTKMPTDFTTYYLSLEPMQWQQPYRFSQYSGSTINASIYEVLSSMSDAGRQKLLQTIYTVRHGNAPNFYPFGLKVKWIK